MSKEPLFPHVPERKAPLFPHTSKKSNQGDERLLKVAIEREPLRVAKQWGYEIHRLSPKDIVDKEDYARGYRYRLSKAGPTQPYPQIVMARSEGEVATFLKRQIGERQTGSSLELLASTEGDPISKFCCRLCGECAPEELLEEGKFPERIAWLRSHYKAKHPGMWGTMSPMTVEDGELVSPEYQHLASLVNEPLPKDAY